MQVDGGVGISELVGVLIGGIVGLEVFDLAEIVPRTVKSRVVKRAMSCSVSSGQARTRMAPLSRK